MEKQAHHGGAAFPQVLWMQWTVGCITVCFLAFQASCGNAFCCMHGWAGHGKNWRLRVRRHAEHQAVAAWQGRTPWGRELFRRLGGLQPLGLPIMPEPKPGEHPDWDAELLYGLAITWLACHGGFCRYEGRCALSAC